MLLNAICNQVPPARWKEERRKEKKEKEEGRWKEEGKEERKSLRQ